MFSRKPSYEGDRDGGRNLGGDIPVVVVEEGGAGESGNFGRVPPLFLQHSLLVRPLLVLLSGAEFREKPPIWQ